MRSVLPEKQKEELHHAASSPQVLIHLLTSKECLDEITANNSLFPMFSFLRILEVKIAYETVVEAMNFPPPKLT